MKLIAQSKTLVFTLTILSIVNPFTVAASDDPLLNMLPSDTLFCVRVNQLNTSLAALDQYLMGASSMPVSAAMLVNMQLAAMVGDPTLAGIDQNGAFMAVGIALPDNSVDMTILAPITDYDAFIKNNPYCQPSSDNPEITLLAAPNSPAGKMVMAPAPGGKYALVNSEDNLSAMLTLQRQLAEKTTRLAAALDADQTAQAKTAPAWVYVNMARLNELYGPMMAAMVEEMAQQAPEMSMGAAAMEMNMQLFKTLVNEGFGQADSVTLALTPEPSVLNLDIAFRAKDGSEMASMFVADPQAPKSFSLTGYSDDAAAVNAVLKTNRLMAQKIVPVITDFLKEAFGEKLSSEDIERVKSLINKSLTSSGDEMFCAFSYGPGQPPFKFRQVQQTTDPAFFRNTAQEGVAVANTMYKAMELPFEFNYNQDVETYKDIKIDTFGFSFASDANDPAAAFLNQMYGADGLTYYAAQKDGLGLITMGPNAKDDIKTLIDTPAKNEPSGELRKAITALGSDAQKADMIASVNILKLAKGFVGMAQQMANQAGAAGANPFLSPIAAALDVQTQSCMALSANVGGGKIAARLALPKQHLMEISTVAMKIQSQMMMPQQGQNGGMMGGQPSGPTSPFAPQPAPQTAQPKDPLQEWVGKPAPDIKMKDLQGNTVSIAGLKGKKIILDFWATWCPPCKEMIPDLVKLRDNRSADQLAILGVSNEPVDRLNKFAKDYKMNYPVISYTGPLPSPYDKIVGIPTTFFIDSAGVIRHVLVGFHDAAEIQAALDSMQ